MKTPQAGFLPIKLQVIYFHFLELFAGEIRSKPWITDNRNGQKVRLMWFFHDDRTQYPPKWSEGFLQSQSESNLLLVKRFMIPTLRVLFIALRTWKVKISRKGKWSDFLSMFKNAVLHNFRAQVVLITSQTTSLNFSNFIIYKHYNFNEHFPTSQTWHAEMAQKCILWCIFSIFILLFSRTTAWMFFRENSKVTGSKLSIF